MSDAPNPGHIMQVGLGFWASKVLLSAVELDLFTKLAEGSRTLAELESALGLHPRASRDFLDALVALGFLGREGDGPGARYSNTADAAMFLDSRSAAFVGGLLKMANGRLYQNWAHLTEAVRTGLPQNEIKQTGKPVFEAIYSSPEALEGFMRAMAGISVGPSIGARGEVRLQSVSNDDRRGRRDGTALDLCGETTPAYRRHHHRSASGRADRQEDHSGGRPRRPCENCFSRRLRGTVAQGRRGLHGQLLHDWDLPQKMLLIRSAYDALPVGGAFIAVDNIIDDARRENPFGLLMSLNMLIETPGGFDYSGADFALWCREVGFKSIEVMPLAGSTSAAIAIK